MNKTWKRVIIAVLVIAFLVWGSKQFTVVNTEKQTAVLEAEKFDRVAYVDAIWDSPTLSIFHYSNRVGCNSGKLLLHDYPDKHTTRHIFLGSTSAVSNRSDDIFSLAG